MTKPNKCDFEVAAASLGSDAAGGWPEDMAANVVAAYASEAGVDYQVERQWMADVEVRKLAEDAYRNVFGEPDEDDDSF